MIGYGDTPEERRLYRVEVPPAYGSTLKAALEDLYGRVERQEPPAVSTAYDADLIASMYPREAPGKVVTLPAEVEDWIVAHEALTKARTELSKQIDTSKARFEQALGDAACGIVPGGKRAIRWRVEEREYAVKSQSRVLRFGKPSKAELDALD